MASSLRICKLSRPMPLRPRNPYGRVKKLGEQLNKKTQEVKRAEEKLNKKTLAVEKLKTEIG